MYVKKYTHNVNSITKSADCIGRLSICNWGTNLYDVMNIKEDKMDSDKLCK
jgi:hypothetical protein